MYSKRDKRELYPMMSSFKSNSPKYRYIWWLYNFSTEELKMKIIAPTLTGILENGRDRHFEHNFSKRPDASWAPTKSEMTT